MLTLDINKNNYSIKGSADGAKKLKAALMEMNETLLELYEKNEKREKMGLKPLPMSFSIKDEFGVDLIKVGETASLDEIRKEKLKWQENVPYSIKENETLQALNEIGNSTKTQYEFNEELRAKLNKNIFVKDANLTPGETAILDYFGNSKGLFCSINFKDDISRNLIKQLIDNESPETNEPPKSFPHLFDNILNVNKVFKNNPNRKEYIEQARTYINISYKHLIPKKYLGIFSERYGLEKLIQAAEIKNEFKQPETNQKEFLNKVSFAMNEEIKNLNMGMNDSAVLIATKNMMKKLNQEQREKFINIINEKNVASIDKGLSFLSKLAEGQNKEDKSKSTKPSVKKSGNIEKDDDRLEV